MCLTLISLYIYIYRNFSCVRLEMCTPYAPIEYHHNFNLGTVGVSCNSVDNQRRFNRTQSSAEMGLIFGWIAAQFWPRSTAPRADVILPNFDWNSSRIQSKSCQCRPLRFTGPLDLVPSSQLMHWQVTTTTATANGNTVHRAQMYKSSHV